MNLEGRLDQVINTKQKSYREALERMLGAILALSKSWAGYEFQRHSTPAWNRLASATEEVGLAFGELAVARKDAIISA